MRERNGKKEKQRGGIAGDEGEYSAEVASAPTPTYWSATERESTEKRQKEKPKASRAIDKNAEAIDGEEKKTRARW